MADHANSETASILNFTGKWEGRFEPSPLTGALHVRALSDAREILAARTSNDDWTAQMLLCLLPILDEQQRGRLEAALAARSDMDGSAQALALVRLCNSNNEHRERVRNAIDALQGRTL